MPAAHELVHTSTPLPPTSFPNACTNTPACVNSLTRLSPWSVTNTSPDPLTATPSGSENWPAPLPTLPAPHQLVHTSTPLPPTFFPNARTNTPACVNSLTRAL